MIKPRKTMPFNKRRGKKFFLSWDSVKEWKVPESRTSRVTDWKSGSTIMTFGDCGWWRSKVGRRGKKLFYQSSCRLAQEAPMGRGGRTAVFFCASPLPHCFLTSSRGETGVRRPQGRRRRAPGSTVESGVDWQPGAGDTAGNRGRNCFSKDPTTKS